MAGVAAATAAAKVGARTFLVEREPFAGGIATASMELSLCNYLHTPAMSLSRVAAHSN